MSRLRRAVRRSGDAISGVAAAVVLAAGGFIALALPGASGPAQISRLGPETVFAICSPDPRASGYLTANGNYNSTGTGPTMINSTTGGVSSATVYAFISDLNGTNDGGSSGEKSCGNPVYRYGGLLWMTSTTQATINWGAFTANGSSSSCYLLYGTRDYFHANWGTTCAWSQGGSPGINYRVLSISLTPGIRYQEDATLDNVGDFEFVWDSCSTFYEGTSNTGKVVKTGVPKSELDNVVGNSTSISWKPGANCGGALTQDGTNTDQTFLVDTTAPAITWTTPSSAIYNTSGSISPAWSVTDSESGVPGAGIVKRQYTSLAANTCGTTWTTEATQTNGASTPLTNARCYRWTFDTAAGGTLPTNGVGTAASSNLTSPIVKVDTTAPVITWTNPSADAYNTTGSITPTWTASDPETGTTSGTVKRQSIGLAANACATWTTTAEATQTNGAATTLTNARCYRWSFDPAVAAAAVKPVNGAGTAATASFTSPLVKVDTTAPVITWTTPSADAFSTTGSITPSWTVSDPETGTTAGTVKRQSIALGNNACGTWTTATEATQSNGVAATLANALCYRWSFDPAAAASAVKPVNGAGTPATANLTSSIIKSDLTVPVITWSTPPGDSYSTSGTITPAWTVADPETGIASAGTVKRQSVALGANACATWGTGSEATQASGVAASLAPATCYRWTFDPAMATGAAKPTNNAGTVASANLTSGMVKSDPTPPVITWSTPAADAYNTSGTITPSWTVTDPESGVASSGTINRQSVALAGNVCAVWDTSSEATQSSGASTALTSGRCYRWTGDPAVATGAIKPTNNAGLAATTNLTSAIVKVDTTPPAGPTVTSSTPSGSYRVGNTIYFLPSAGSTITLTSDGDDPVTGIVSSTFGPLTAPTGWTYSPGTVAGDPAGTTLTWSPTAGTTTLDITTTNGAGLTSPVTTITFIADSAPPTATYTYPAQDVYRSSTGSFAVTWTESDSAGAGVSMRNAQWQTAPLSNGTCGTPNAPEAPFAPTPGTTTRSPVSDATCYRLLLVLTDNLGTSSATATSAWVKIDATAPLISSLAPAPPTVTQTATTVNVSWSETDPASGVASRGLQRQRASATAASQCDTATYVDDLGVRDLTSPVAETGLSTSTCYRWRLTLTDRAGNQSAVSTSGNVFVATPAPPAPTVAPDLDTASDTGPLAPATSTYTLRPDSDVLISGGSINYVPSGPPAYLLVDEVTLNTNDYFKPEFYGIVIMGFPNGVIPANDTILSVTIAGKTQNGAPSNAGYLAIRDPASGELWRIYEVGQNSPADSSVTLTTRPWDGKPWTVADIDAIQAGAQNTCGSYCGLRINQFWISVTAVGRTPPGYTSDNVTADTTPTFSGTVDPSAASVRLYEGTTLLGTDTSVSTGTWQVTSSLLADGIHSITARAVSAGGSESAASPALSVTIASTGPVVDLLPGSDLGPQVLVDKVATLWPTSDALLTGSPTFAPAGPTAWNLVDEAWLKTDDYVRPENGGMTILGFQAASAVASADRISSVTIRADTSNGAVANAASLVVRNPATGAIYPVLSIGQNSPSDQVVTLTARPWGGSWTKADVDSLQAGGSCASSYCNLVIRRIYVEVNYRPVSSSAYSSDNLTADNTPTFSGANSTTAARVDLLRDGVVVGSDVTVSDGTWTITSNASSDGPHVFTGLAYDGDGLVTSTLPALTVTIDTVAPAAPGAPDLTAATDNGVSATDNITSVKQPGFTGTTTGATTVALFDEATHVADDVAPSTTYALTASWPLLAGERPFTTVAYDLAGNASAPSVGLSVRIVDYLRTAQASVQGLTHVGAETWVVVTTRDETGEPISSYSGTVTVTTDDPSAVFPDGNTYAFAARPDETGVNIRVLFGSTGPSTITVSGSNGIVSSAAYVTVAGSDLTVTAPATVYQNVRFILRVRPHDATDRLLTAYAASTTFSSTDPTANYGAEVSSNQYTFTCACDDGHTFPTRLGTLGTQTITVTDQFGNTDQVVVNVVAAPAAIANPFEVRAVQWNHGNIADFYIDPGAFAGSYSVVGIEHRCTATGSELLGVTDFVGTFTGISQFSSASIPRPDCSNINNWDARAHTLFIIDGLGHQWAVGPSGAGANGSLSSAGVFWRFSSIPNNSRWTMIDPGNPVNSISNTQRNSSPINQATSPSDGSKIWKWVPFGDTISINLAEPATIRSVSIRTDIITDFDKGIWPFYSAGYSSGQVFPLAAGQQSFQVDDIQYGCWFGPHNASGIRFTIFNANGRRGIADVGLLPPAADGNAWCSGPMGQSPSPLVKPYYADLFDSFRAWAETDPVDPYEGGYLQGVTDFAIGGLSPSLSLSRQYNSQVAEAEAAGTETRFTLFGRGWSSSLDWSLVDTGGNGEKTLYAGGERLRFDLNANGTYSPVTGTAYKLTVISGGFKVTDSVGAGRRFDSTGRMVAIFDPHGREMTLAYVAGKLTSVTDASGRIAQVATNAAGLVTRIDLPDGRHVDFTYDTNGFMATQRTLDGQILTFVSDRRGRITQLRDSAGETLLTNFYDGTGRVFRQTDALGNPSFLVYNTRTDSQVTRVISPRGGVTTDCFGLYGASLVGRVDAEGGLRTWTYDQLGNPLTATDELGNTTRYQFDASGRPTRIVDALGRTVTITYNAAGLVSSMTDAAGGQVTVAFDATTGLPSTVTQSKGANSMVTATYSYDPVTKLPRFISGPTGTGTGELQYDSRGYTSASIDAEGRKTTFVTDARGFITQIVDPLGNAAGGNPALHRTTYTYDDMGRVLTVSNPLDETTTYTYDEFGRLASAETPLGNLTTYGYDDLGQLTSVTEELTASSTATTHYEYDDDGNLSAIVDAEDRRTEYLSDLVGRLIVTTDQDEKVWRSEYDAAGRLVKTIDPTDRTTEMAYDAVGRITSTTDSAGMDTTYTYTPADLLETVTDPLTHTTTYGYDWRNFRTSTTNAKTETTTASYDDAGHLLSVTDARLKTTSYEYDLTGLLRRVIEHGGIETTYDYDDAGRLETQTNDRGGTETYGYDNAGRVTSLTDVLNNVWQSVYDDDGRVQQAIDANSQTTTFGYDRAGRLLTVTPQSGPAITYVYDKTDRLQSMTDGNGATQYGYDPVGRLASVERAGRTTSYGYDDAGRPTTVTYPAGQGAVGYEYDPAGRLETVTDWDGRQSTYVYDDASRVTSVARPGQLNSAIGYDELDRPTSVTHTRAGNPVLSLGYSYDAAGNLATYADDLGTATFGYDDLNRLTSASYPGGQAYGYTYDTVGNMLTASTPSGNRSYTYDLANRITSAGPPSAPGGNGSLTRPPTANNAGWSNSGSAYASDDVYATASPAKNATTTVDVSAFDFSSVPASATIDQVTVTVEWKVDNTSSNATLGAQAYVGASALGSETVNSAEPIADTAQSFTVSGVTRSDLANLKVRVRATRGNSNNAFTASLDSISIKVDYSYPPVAAAPTYDNNGNMTSDGSYGNRTYTYDALGRLTGVAGNGVTASYALDGQGNRWAETINGSTTSFDLDLAASYPTILGDGTRSYLPGAPGFGYEEAGVWYSGLVDQHGSLLGTVSESGVQSPRVTYDPYGAPRPSSPSPSGVGFTGEWTNATGLVNMRYRQYDPVLGRFIGRDSFGGLSLAPQTLNRYTFGSGSPLLAADPSGHFNNHLIMPVRLFVSMGVSFMGPVGMGYDLFKAIIGYDIIAGIELTPEDRIISIAEFAVVGAITKILSHLSDLAPPPGALSHADDYRPLTHADDASPLSHLDDAPGVSQVDEAAPLNRVDVDAEDVWTVGRHGDMPRPRTGYESHHGVNSVWAEANVPGYRAVDAPAILMKTQYHNRTRSVFNTWRTGYAARTGGSARNVDWRQVSPKEIRGLAESQFDAAGVPQAIRDEYWRQWDDYLAGLR